MGKNNKKGPKGNVFKVAGAKSLKKSKAKAVNLGLKNASLRSAALLQTSTSTKHRRKLGQPVKYKRKPGSRRYLDYTQKQLEECLAAVKSKKFTQRDASDYYDIPRSTIKNKLARKNCSKPGRQPIFSEEEEDLFVSQIAALSDFGFPLSNHDIKMVIKDYLTTQNKTVTVFRNNLPGKDWLKYFFDRHKALCDHLESKFETLKTQLSESVISDFIDHLSYVTENVPPQNIYCFYEISLRDDPTLKTIVCRRGVKYPETSAIQAAKAKFSVMFCGNAVGETIPPYVIYKAEPGCSTWTENGPIGARYNCTQSGWMNSDTFENWFRVQLLPVLRKKRGKKVLIGDNVSSHINGKVLTLCEKYNIVFICLPHKSSHILQPLHYAYFQPLRPMWNQLLLDWQVSQVAKKLPTTLNKYFPYLLKKAVNALSDISRNIIVGFEKCGIYPIDKEEPIYRLPISHQRIIDNHMLKETDFETNHIEIPSSFNKQGNLRIITKKEIESSISDMEVIDEDSCFSHSQYDLNSPELIPKEEYDSSISELDVIDEDGSLNITLDDPGSPEIIPKEEFESRISGIDVIEGDGSINVMDGDVYIVVVQGDQVLQIPLKVPEFEEEIQTEYNPLHITVGDHVIVTYGTNNYPGKVLAVSAEGAYVHCMKKWKSLWRWPSAMKEQLYSWDEIICKINAPKLVKRGCFFIPEIDCN